MPSDPPYGLYNNIKARDSANFLIPWQNFYARKSESRALSCFPPPPKKFDFVSEAIRESTWVDQKTQRPLIGISGAFLDRYDS